MSGYILESRQIQNSEIWRKPPLYFKVWHYLLMEAQYQDNGNLKRGQLFTSIDEIAEACSYYVGYRKVKPSRKEIWNIIEFLRKPDEGNNEEDTKGTMIVTTKVTHGILVTICNYNVYQDPNFYEGNNEGNNEKDTKGTTKRTTGEQYYKEREERKKKKYESTTYSCQNVVENYNRICVSLPRVEKLTDKRKSHINARLREHSLDEIKMAFIKAEQSDFLSGRQKDWHADFDWMTKSEDNLVKILEGHYDNRDRIRDETEKAYNEIMAGVDEEELRKAEEVLR